jgi:hypothetical protein
MEPETFTMSEKIFFINMLDNLRPSFWKSIVFTLLLLGMIYGLFEGTAPDTGAAVKTLVMGAFDLAAAVFVWIDYQRENKIYHKYQSKLIELTEIKEVRQFDKLRKL